LSSEVEQGGGASVAGCADVEPVAGDPANAGPMLIGLLFPSRYLSPVGRAGAVPCHARHAGGRIDRVVVAVPRTARPPEGDDPPPLPTLKWLSDHTAYLTVLTFRNARFRKADATFPQAIHDVFVEIAKHGATDMILDLRENGGGSEPNESILFSYLVEKPLHKYAAVNARGRHIAVTSLSGRTFKTDVFEDDDVDQQL